MSKKHENMQQAKVCCIFLPCVWKKSKYVGKLVCTKT